MEVDALADITELSPPDIVGSYYLDPSAEAVRVRVVIEGGSLVLYTLSDRLVARWSLNQLKNLGISVWGETWTIGDRRLRGPTLNLESDAEYAILAAAAPVLRSVHARFWARLGFATVESSQQTGLIVLLLAAIIAAAAWLWTQPPIQACIATHQNVILFLECTIEHYFLSQYVHSRNNHNLFALHNRTCEGIIPEKRRSGNDRVDWNSDEGSGTCRKPQR